MKKWTVLDECISEKDYLASINVWNVLEMNTMGDYHDVYLKIDVLLLTDIFEKFINMCLDYYGLDPCHYFGNPGLSWDATLEWDRIRTYLKHLFIEKGTRGGISYITKRHSKANNKYIECYEEYKENKYIMYLDANNLYGWEMSQYLPYKGFKFLKQKEIDKFCLNSVLIVQMDTC